MRQSEPSRAVEGDFGQKCYREPGAPFDGRPVLWRRPFWESIEEEADYLIAIRANPKGPDERSFNYVARIAGIVSGAGEAVQSMPEAREPGEDG